MLPVARSQETVRAAAPAHAESASSSRHTRAVASRLRCWCRPAGYHATLARVGRTLVFQIYTVIEKDAKCVVRILYTSYPAVLRVVRTHRSMLCKGQVPTDGCAATDLGPPNSPLLTPELRPPR